jgi:DNA-binding response OmpR family regulator
LAEKQIANLTVLAVLPAEEDRKSIERVLAHSKWKLTFARDFRESQAKLRRSVPGVVISDHDLSNGYCWKDLLQELGVLEDPPPLIVVTRLADDFLWAEVLNLGAHDLLAKPFDKRDVLHAVSTASRTARTNALCGRSGEFPFWGKLAAKPKRVPRLTHRKYRQRPARDKS